MHFILKTTANFLATLLVVSSSTFLLTGCNQTPEHSEKEHEHKHDEHEHKHDEHEHKHDEHEHKHDEHEHKHDEHEHKHDGHGHKHDEHGHTHIGKHVHGEGELTAVIDNNRLVIDLMSPAMNVFGFEHQPKTDAQKATVKQQQAILEDVNQLFSVDGGECSLDTFKVDMPFSKMDQTEQTDDVHSDVKATYTFNCKKTADINKLSVKLFDTFTGFTSINASWVNADKQGASHLTQDSVNIVFK